MTGGGAPALETRSARGGPGRRDELLRAIGIDVPLLFAAKVAVGACVLSTGFTHVSDDDYARVVIAQQFAHHPTLDPSGTSWLPFPFWITGAAMIALGRSLLVARALACALGVVSVAAPYAAMRAVGCGRATALVGLGVALALPWSAWLGVATVPEAPTACLIAAAAIAVTSSRARVLAAFGLFAASLSRYEAWPVCGVFAVASVLEARAAKESHSKSFGAAAIAIAGPLAWLGWNAYAHGSALHFVARVSAYRQAIGAAAVPLSTKLTAFPLALASAAPSVLALALVGAVALPFDVTLRHRWSAPLASAFAILAFLVYGDVRDGAPTHHSERAIVPIVWILAPFAADALRTIARRVAWARPAREMWAFGLSLAGALAWIALLPEHLRDAPGRSPGESRTAQIARGEGLPAEGGAEATWDVTPCAYEHFALMAAETEPWRFRVLPAVPAPVTWTCPRVALHRGSP